MNDTSPEIERKLMELVMSRSGEERFMSAMRSFDAARAIVISSLPKNLSDQEFKHRLFERTYGASIEQVVSIVRDGPEE